jgi:benzoylformate decarboxylase
MREKIVALLQGHDVILVVGAPAFTYHVEGHGPHVPAGATLCQLVDDPATAARTAVGIATVGSIRLGLLDLIEKIVNKERAEPARRDATVRAEASAPMSVAYVLQTLCNVRDPRSIIVEEAPSARAVMQRYLPITRSDGFYTMASGGLGWSMPAAVGIALAKPDEKVIALLGDGSSMYSIQALWTAAHSRLPITFIVLNNRRYAALEDFAPVFGFGKNDRLQGVELPDLDFVGLARAQGCDGARVSLAVELKDALVGALQSTGPFLLEIEVA